MLPESRGYSELLRVGETGRRQAGVGPPSQPSPVGTAKKRAGDAGRALAVIPQQVE